MPNSVFYYHRVKLDSDDKYAVLKQRIAKLYHQHKGRYGYRRMTIALKQLGMSHNHKLIAKLMRHLNLSARIQRQRYRSYKGIQGEPVIHFKDTVAGQCHDDIVARFLGEERPLRHLDVKKKSLLQRWFGG